MDLDTLIPLSHLNLYQICSGCIRYFIYFYQLFTNINWMYINIFDINFIIIHIINLLIVGPQR